MLTPLTVPSANWHSGKGSSAATNGQMRWLRHPLTMVVALFDLCQKDWDFGGII
jgi:hypothetical protein